jgi:hypothetical protein
MRQVIVGLATIVVLAAGCGPTVNKRSYVRQLTFLCGQVNLALADVDPAEEPERFANQFTQLLSQIRGMQAPEEDGAVLRRLVAAFERTRDRFVAAQEADARGDGAVADAEADAGMERLGQTSDIATEYGMPPLTECDETATLAPSPPPATPSGEASPPGSDEAGSEGPPPTAPAEVAGWRRVADLGVARQQFAATNLDGAVYITGGLLRTRATRSVEVLDSAVGQWRSAPRLPVALHHHMAVAYDSALVVLGGWRFDGGDPTGRVSDRVFILRPGASAWDELPRLRRPRAAGAAAVADAWSGRRRCSTGAIGRTRRRSRRAASTSPRHPTGATSTSPAAGTSARRPTSPPWSAMTHAATVGAGCGPCRPLAAACTAT